VSSLTDADRELIALHLAALRRHGWPAAKAMALVAQGMPAGDAQRELERVSSELAAGVKPDPVLDPFLALLAQGEAAGPDALSESVRGSQMASAAKRSRRLAALIGSAVAAGASLVGFFTVALFQGSVWQSLSFGALPLPTQKLIELTDLVGYPGPLFVLGLGILPWLVPEAWLPHVGRYRAASRLRQFAAALAAKVPADAAAKLLGTSEPAQLFGSPGLGLSGLDRKLGEFLLARDGAAVGARILAEELQAEAELGSGRFSFWAPVAGQVAIFLLVLQVVGAFYLPLFTIAGSVK